MKRFAALWLSAILVLAALPCSAQPEPSGQQGHSAERPNASDREAKTPQGNPVPTERRDEPAKPGTEQQKGEESGIAYLLGLAKWGLERVVAFAEANEHAIVAIGTLFIAAFTVILGLATIFLWLATKKLVEGAELTAERQLRAYIGVPGVELPNPIAYADTACIMQTKIKNFGQTPAFKVTIRARVVIASQGTPSFDVCDVKPEIYNTINPADTRVIGKKSKEIVSIEDERLIREGKRPVYMFGTVNYLDIFDSLQTFRFCHVFGGTGDAFGNVVRNCDGDNEPT